jgi:crossover junction endodeoxyribonuclease RusA
VELAFMLVKPASAPKKKQTWPVHRPDLDKLVRAVLDALTGSIIIDDSQVVSLVATKEWETNGPGVMVMVQEDWS